jgi:SAM-dependent methyltransferase
VIEVLRTWLDVGQATLALQRMRLPTHITVQKNWDQFLLARLLAKMPRQAPVLDLGCGSCSTLKLLAGLGFRELSGVDLRLPPGAARLPFRLREGDLTHAPFPDGAFALTLSISTIEHGVDLAAFFGEARRLLVPGGLLFVTTDYWEEKIPVDDSVRPFGLPWRIFSRAEIEAAIATARGASLELLRPDATIPPCVHRTVTWQGRDYTFLAMVFRRCA